MTINLFKRGAICASAIISLCFLGSCQGRTADNVTPNGETIDVTFDSTPTPAPADTVVI